MWLRIAVLLLGFASTALAWQATNTPLANAPVPPSDLGGKQLVERSIRAMRSDTPVTDAVLTGTAIWQAGSEKQVVDAHLTLKAPDKCRLDLDGGSLHSELQNGAFQNQKAEIINADGVPHRSALHNSQVPASLLFPAFLLDSLLESGGTVQSLGEETLSGSLVDHLRYFHTYPIRDQSLAQAMQKFSTVDLYIDATNSFPLKITYTIHPNDNARRDIPVELHFSDYQLNDGVFVPHHLERIVQGITNLNLTIDGVSINSDVPESQFSLR